jgi:hypothetical protein
LVQIQNLAVKAREILSIVSDSHAVAAYGTPGLSTPIAPYMATSSAYTSSTANGVMGPSFGQTPNYEQFGARVIRELVAMAPDMVRSFKESPAELVRAIAEAKANGLDAIANRLEKRLFESVAPPPEVGDLDAELARSDAANQVGSTDVGSGGE